MKKSLRILLQTLFLAFSFLIGPICIIGGYTLRPQSVLPLNTHFWFVEIQNTGMSARDNERILANHITQSITAIAGNQKPIIVAKDQSILAFFQTQQSDRALQESRFQLLSDSEILLKKLGLDRASPTIFVFELIKLRERLLREEPKAAQFGMGTKDIAYYLLERAELKREPALKQIPASFSIEWQLDSEANAQQLERVGTRLSQLGEQLRLVANVQGIAFENLPRTQIEMNYDPHVVHSLGLTPGSILKQVIQRLSPQQAAQTFYGNEPKATRFLSETSISDIESTQVLGAEQRAMKVGTFSQTRLRCIVEPWILTGLTSASRGERLECRQGQHLAKIRMHVFADETERYVVRERVLSILDSTGLSRDPTMKHIVLDKDERGLERLLLMMFLLCCAGLFLWAHAFKRTQWILYVKNMSVAFAVMVNMFFIASLPISFEALALLGCMVPVATLACSIEYDLYLERRGRREVGNVPFFLVFITLAYAVLLLTNSLLFSQSSSLLDTKVVSLLLSQFIAVGVSYIFVGLRAPETRSSAPQQISVLPAKSNKAFIRFVGGCVVIVFVSGLFQASQDQFHILPLKDDGNIKTSNTTKIRSVGKKANVTEVMLARDPISRPSLKSRTSDALEILRGKAETVRVGQQVVDVVLRPASALEPSLSQSLLSGVPKGAPLIEQIRVKRAFDLTQIVREGYQRVKLAVTYYDFKDGGVVGYFTTHLTKILVQSVFMLIVGTIFFNSTFFGFLSAATFNVTYSTSHIVLAASVLVPFKQDITGEHLQMVSLILAVLFTGLWAVFMSYSNALREDNVGLEESVVYLNEICNATTKFLFRKRFYVLVLASCVFIPTFLIGVYLFLFAALSRIFYTRWILGWGYLRDTFVLRLLKWQISRYTAGTR